MPNFIYLFMYLFIIFIYFKNEKSCFKKTVQISIVFINKLFIIIIITFKTHCIKETSACDTNGNV